MKPGRCPGEVLARFIRDVAKIAAQHLSTSEEEALIPLPTSVQLEMKNCFGL